jgi:hypothetical protein
VTVTTPATALLPQTPVPYERRPGAGGDWPYTTRLLPWFLAGFLVMICVVPFDSIELPVSLPVDSELDRVLLMAIAVAWVVAVVRRRPGPELRSNAMAKPIVLFIGVASASVIVNGAMLARYQELPFVMKDLAILLSLATFFFIVSTSLRPAELGRFSVLFVFLASVAALGTVIEYRTDFNPFFELSDEFSFGMFSVDLPTEKVDGVGRRNITGPTTHGLSMAALLAMALPFATLGLVRARNALRRSLWILALALLLAGALATVRKTSVILPLGALLVLLCYRPREILRFAPVGAVLLVSVHALAPEAMGTVADDLKPSNLFALGSTQGRTEDYTATAPDISSKPVLGRGYGSFDPLKYRFLDNQYLGMLVVTGFIGLAAWILLLLSGMLISHRASRNRAPELSELGVAVVAAVVVFAIASFLFDTLSFPQPSYLFFFVLAMAAVAARQAVTARLPEVDWLRSGSPAVMSTRSAG